MKMKRFSIIMSPHTVLKDFQTKCCEHKHSMSSNDDDDDNQIRHYSRLLQEAEQALASRNTLIIMLQEQLRKIENLYKKSLDNTQDFRFKYSVTIKEFRNLRRICEKYKEDIAALTKEINKEETNEGICSIKKEADSWKFQYNELSKKIEFMEKDFIVGRVLTTSKDVQVELIDNQNLKNDLDVLKDHYINIEGTLHNQNDKLELIVGRLQEDLRKSETEREELEKVVIISKERLTVITTEAIAKKVSLESVLKENEILKGELKVLKLKNEKLLLNKDANQCDSQSLNSLNKVPELQKLKNEMQLRKAEIKNLHEQDIQLQEQSLDIAGHKNNPTEKRKQENLEFSKETERFKQNSSTALYHNFNECLCFVKTEDSDKTKNYPNSPKERLSSKVSFVIPENLFSESIELLRKCSNSQQLQEVELDHDDTEKLNMYIDELHRHLKFKEGEIEYLKTKIEEIIERKNELLQEFDYKSELLKNDYEDLSKRKDIIENNLKQKISEVSDYQLTVQTLKDGNEKLKLELDSLHNDHKQLVQENGNIQDNLKNKTEELHDQEAYIQHLQETVDKLQITLSTIQEENKCINERACVEETGIKLNKLELEVNELSSIIDNIKCDNDTLELQIDEMAKLLQQYKEEVKFKKMENEKLRKNEQELQCNLLCSVQENKQILKEYQEEVEKNKQIGLKITEEYNNLKKSCEDNISQLNDDRNNLLSLVQSKNEEINQLKDKINEITQELKKVNLLYRKETNLNERTISEITSLFKNKEEEVLAIGEELRGQEEDLEKLEKENNELKKLIDAKKDIFKADTKLLCETKDQKENEKQKQYELSQNIKRTNKIKVLNEKHDEKTKIVTCSNYVNNICEELRTLSLEVLKLLQNLESTLGDLKQEIKNNDCDTASTDIVNAMLNHIEIFSDVLENNACSRFKGFAKSTEVCNTVCGSSFISDINKNVLSYIPECYITGQNSEELLIKKQYLTTKVKSIDNKLDSFKQDAEGTTNNLLGKSTMITDADSPISQKLISKGSKLSAADIEELHFKRKHYANSLDSINKKLFVNNNLKQMNDKGCCGHLRPPQMTNENIYPVMKMPLNTMNLPEENKTLEYKINDLKYQVETPNSVPKQIFGLEQQLKAQLSELIMTNSNSPSKCHNNVCSIIASSAVNDNFKDNPKTYKQEKEQVAEVKTLKEPICYCPILKYRKTNMGTKKIDLHCIKRCSERTTHQKKKLTGIPVFVQNTQKSKCHCSETTIRKHKTKFQYEQEQTSELDKEKKNKGTVDSTAKMLERLCSYCKTYYPRLLNAQSSSTKDLQKKKCKCKRNIKKDNETES